MRHAVSLVLAILLMTSGCGEDGEDPVLDGSESDATNDSSADASSDAEESDAALAPTCGDVGYMEDCSGGGSCGSCMCHAYGMGDIQLCTIACEDASDCPAPSGGCSNMGVCKKPG